MRRIFLVIAVILVVALIAGIAYWYFVLSKKPPSEIAPGTKPTPVASFSVINLCRDFQKTEGEISCEQAIGIATAKYPGKAQSVSPARTLPQKDSPNSTVKNMWRVDLLLDTPLKKDQDIFESARIFIDRISGEEIRSTYLKKS